MSQIQVTDLTYGYEGSFDTVFENVSFGIDTDWKLGLIGRNGKGKTTFLNLLRGKYKYEGNITSSAVFDYFPYQISEKQRENCASLFLEEVKPGCEEWRVIVELGKLHADAELLYRPFKSLSHGEQTKVLLAVLFSGENDFLLIDEPTNHLDQDAREIIKKYLASKKGFILVSHDRDLLDACIDHVLVLKRASIEVQSGNFSSWWENKEKADNFARMEHEKHVRRPCFSERKKWLWKIQPDQVYSDAEPAKFFQWRNRKAENYDVRMRKSFRRKYNGNGYLFDCLKSRYFLYQPGYLASVRNAERICQKAGN